MRTGRVIGALSPGLVVSEVPVLVDRTLSNWAARCQRDRKEGQEVHDSSDVVVVAEEGKSDFERTLVVASPVDKVGGAGAGLAAEYIAFH